MGIKEYVNLSLLTNTLLRKVLQKHTFKKSVAKTHF